MHRWLRLIAFISLSVWLTPLWAYSAEFTAGIKQAQEAATQGTHQAQQVMTQYDAKSVFDHYDPNPEQKKLYTDINQSSAEAMEKKANEEFGRSEVIQTIISSKNNRPNYRPNFQTADMQRALLIQSEADNIIRGVTSQYIDCAPKKSCETQYIKKMCTRTAIADDLSCRKNLVVNVVPPNIQESWSSSCNLLEQYAAQGICHVKEEKCLLANTTKTINDVTVTRPCWEKKVSYQCNATSISDDCSTLDQSQCEQLQSTCNQKIGDVCLSYQQTYRCPQTSCLNTANIICGDGKDYCLNGDCMDHGYTPSKDFGKALTAMAATNESAKGFDTSSIFKGKPIECRDDGDFSNCCQGEGWGQDIHLAHCNQKEKELGTAREKRYAVYVGRYCSKKVLGHCVENKETYCVFGSKIAKVIQDQGRRGQLHIGFGNGRQANCRGITPDQLQRINFARIDFGNEIMTELNKKLKSHDSNSTANAINNRVQQYQQMGQSNE